MGESGKAVGIEHIPELVTTSLRNLNKDTGLAALLESGRLKIVTGDGRLGHPEDGPYDAIHVGAAAPEIPPAVSVHRSLTNDYQLNGYYPHPLKGPHLSFLLYFYKNMTKKRDLKGPAT